MPAPTQPLILFLEQIRAADLPAVGGKGANLGELTAAGLPVPPGFCVTTSAFRLWLESAPDTAAIYAELAALRADDVESVRRVGQSVRARLAAVPMPPAVAAAVRAALAQSGPDATYAVRSSATAEDLPSASFAGQQDTYLNIRGADALVEHVQRCWVSLFTDRAILYRAQQGFDHRTVALAVVVQQLVQSQVSGIMFTADPVSGNRHIATIDASFGLGEALVAGLVSADLFHIDKRSLSIVNRQIADKQIAIRPLPEGGVEQVDLPAAQRQQPALSDDQVRELGRLAVRIEQHYQRPQDIEWALVDGAFFITQSRPITSLFPLPEPQPHDEALHAYFSFSHLQVMTDPLPPLAQDVWRILIPFGQQRGAKASELMKTAGGRLYVDISPLLRHPLLKRMLPVILTRADPLVAAGMKSIAARPEFQQRGATVRMRSVLSFMLPILRRTLALLGWRSTVGLQAQINREIEQRCAEIEQRLAAAPTQQRRTEVAQDILSTALLRAFKAWIPLPLSGVLASSFLQRLPASWADQADVNLALRGLEGNVTTEMDLAVGDLADLARSHPAVMQHLSEPALEPLERLETLEHIAGGREFLAQWHAFLQRYGMRGNSEIDISRPRWHDQPAMLLQVVLGSLQHASTQTHRAHYAAMVVEGEAAGRRLAERARRGPLGWLRGRIVARLVHVARTCMALREHPKFFLVRMLGMIKPVLLESGATLVRQQQLSQPDDVWFLRFTELLDALRDRSLDLRATVERRRADHARFKTLTPPRIITSEGEIPSLNHNHANLPAGALPGTPVSAGTVEGLARVVIDPHVETVRPGEILVAPFTDPGWTPLFINAAGLITEVGGLMTHGSVVAREYGIPAVVGVIEATKRIRTGQRLRVHGDAGYIEILEDAAASAEPDAAPAAHALAH